MGLGPTLAATLYGAIAVIAAYFLRPRFSENPSAARAAIFWLLTTPILFTLPSQLGALALCAVLLLILTPRNLDERAAFYLMTLIAVPSALVAAVPFPGLNYLIALDFALAACLILLLPALAFAKAPLSAHYAPSVGVFLLLFTLLVALQDFRAANFTSGLRDAFGHIFLYAIPFMALIRLLPSRAHFDRIFSTFAFIGVIFVFAAFISQLTKWNYYTFVVERFGYAMLADFRYGILRVSVTLNTVLAGYVMLLGMLAVEYFRARRIAGFITAWIWRGLFALTAFFTFSRGAWLAIAVGMATYYFFTKFPKGVRPALMTLGLAIAIPSATMFAITADLTTLDAFNTFEYRRELIRASLVQISENPFFGDPLFRESPHLAHMVQGQGIIDIVNHYLQIVMENGLAGLTLYLGAFGAAIVGLLRLGDFRNAPKEMELQRAVLLGFIAAYLTLIATTSAVSLVSHFGVIILALSAAFVAAARAEMKSAAAPTATGEDLRNDEAGVSK